MKHLLVLTIIISAIIFIGCEKDKTESVKLFSPEKISLLALDSVGDFWINTPVTDISDFVTASYDLDPNHDTSIRYSSFGAGIIAVSVFVSQESAIAAMEYRIKEVAAIIVPGDTVYLGTNNDWYKKAIQQIDDKWWWAQSSQSLICINKWNTLIEAGNLDYTLPFDSITLVNVDAAIEVSKRVDALSY